jgi:hypothetical protein
MDNLPGSLRDMRTALAVFGAQAVLIYGVLLVPQDFLKSHAHMIYLTHYCLFLPFLFNSRDRCAFLFSPSFLIVSYVCLSFVIGSFAFANGYVMSPKDLADFRRWEHYNFATFYFMMCNMCAVFAYFLARRGWLASGSQAVQSSLRPYIPQLVLGGILLATFSLVGMGLSMFGGSGNFSIVPQTFGFLVITIALARARWRYRFLVYIGLLLPFAAANYLNRRVVLVLVLCLAFIEATGLQDLRLSLRRVALCLGLFALAAFLLVTMTIARGLAGFKGSYWETFRKIDSFVTLDNVTTYSLKTTEGPTTFFHSNNGIHYILKDPSLLCYGSTLAKVLFIPVPRSILPTKPQSMVDIYTTQWDPAWRRLGCSVGINVYAEYFWNFQVLGMFCIIPIFYYLNRLFFFLLDRLRSGTAWPSIYLCVGYSSLLMYGRGHGLHSLAIDVALALTVQWVLFDPFVSLLVCRESKGIVDREIPIPGVHVRRCEIGVLETQV